MEGGWRGAGDPGRRREPPPESTLEVIAVASVLQRHVDRSERRQGELELIVREGGERRRGRRRPRGREREREVGGRRWVQVSGERQ